MPDAEVLLGMTYLKGEDVPRDLVQADAFLRRAAAHGDPLAPRLIPSAEKHMTADQLSTAREMAATWRPKQPATPAADQEK
jgi:TPR repeat protein